MSELIGFIAGSLVAISVFPQVLKSWKTKSTKDISISQYYSYYEYIYDYPEVKIRVISSQTSDIICINEKIFKKLSFTKID